MQALVEVILPVFLVLGFGYLASWRGWMSEAGVDGLMTFAQKFALPCLLFKAIATLNLPSGFNPLLLVSFYSGAVGGFIVGMMGARLLFKRDWEDSVAIGFVCLFSNSLLLGLPITERAYGTDALAHNYVIVAFHAPFCYAVGITVMEIVRARGGGSSARRVAGLVLNAMFRNALILGILAGALARFSGLVLPGILSDGLDLMTRAALPAALFGLGGILYRYRPEGDMRTIAFACAVSLLVHPSITWAMGGLTGLSTEGFRSAVVTASMAPGVNAYLFANMYGRAKRVAASTVLFATAASIFTVWVWLGLLP